MKYIHHVPTMTPAQCAALVRLCRVHKAASIQVRHMGAVDNAEPARIAHAVGISLTADH